MPHHSHHSLLSKLTDNALTRALNLAPHHSFHDRLMTVLTNIVFTSTAFVLVLTASLLYFLLTSTKLGLRLSRRVRWHLHHLRARLTPYTRFFSLTPLKMAVARTVAGKPALRNIAVKHDQRAGGRGRGRGMGRGVLSRTGSDSLQRQTGSVGRPVMQRRGSEPLSLGSRQASSSGRGAGNEEYWCPGCMEEPGRQNGCGRGTVTTEACGEPFVGSRRVQATRIPVGRYSARAAHARQEEPGYWESVGYAHSLPTRMPCS